MTTTSVAITGLGLLTPAGVGVENSWAGVSAGESVAATDPELADLPVDFSCRIPGFDPIDELGRKNARRLDRFSQLGVAAARQAVADAGLDPATWDGTRVGVVLGCGLGGAGTWETQHRRMLEQGAEKISPMLIPMLIPNMVAGHVAMDLGANGPNLVTATACASGATALGTARDLLRSGACDIVLTGGTEAGVTPLSVAGFAQMQALSTRGDDPAAASRPFDANRDGFVVGEASGVVVLERPEDAAARGARTRAYLAGYGASADAHHATAPDPEGRGQAQAMEAALADADVSGTDVQHVNAHGTATPLNDTAEAASITRVIGTHPTVTSTKGVTGHTLGAAGAIEAVFTVLTIEHGRVPPTANCDSQDPGIDLDIVTKAPRDQRVEVAMSDSFGFGGQNAVLVFTAA